MFGQLRVVELLANPGRFAELVEPDHARTALQRVEGSTQSGQQSQLFRCLIQFGTRRGSVGQDLARLFEEDIAHLVVLGKLAARQLLPPLLDICRPVAGRGLARQIEVQRERRLIGSHQRLSGGQRVQANRPSGSGHEVDQRF